MATNDKSRHGYHDLRRQELLNLIPTSAKQILDCGCGTGELGKAIKKRQKCHITGIELNKEAFRLAEQNLDLAFCDNLNRHDPALHNQRYDCIIFGDILEHLISPWWVLIRFQKVLADGGTIVASIPNVAHSKVINQLQRGIFRYEAAGLLDITHLRFFTKTTIFQLFYKAGLKVVDCTPYPSDENPLQYLISATKPTLRHVKPLVSIIILSYNTWRFTKACINAIKERTTVPYKIIVVDNGSSDETVRNLRADTDIFHIENTCNHGFSRGLNIGLELVDTPYFVISNSDIVVSPGWLSTLKKHIDTDDNLMLIGPVSNYVSGPQQVETDGYTNDESMLKFARYRRECFDKPLVYHFSIVFFCALLKSIVLNKIGYLDENFEKSNYEDDDYCLRIHHAGLQAAFDPSVFVHHWGRATFKENKIDWNDEMKTNKDKFLKKYKITSYGPSTGIPKKPV